MIEREEAACAVREREREEQRGLSSSMKTTRSLARDRKKCRRGS
jgi:hypothetical protein